ncbi:MAG: zinc ribbon domain-containing protein [Planctomycetota bacterium]
MGATRDVLYRLQSIETQIRSVRDKIESKKRTVLAHRRKVATIKRQIEDIQGLITKAQVEADQMELERKTHEEHLDRLRDLLNQAKTNKEYAAILTQLNTDKAGTLKLEDKVLAVLNHIDDHKQQEAGLRTQLEKEESLVGELEASVADFESELSGQLEDLLTQRAEACALIPPEALSIFERACEKHDGEATAAVKKVHPKREEYICSGCNMSVRLETVNSLRISRDTVLQCEICSRILFIEMPEGMPAESSVND